MEPHRWSVVRLPSPVAEWIQSTSRRIGAPPYRVLGVLMDGLVDRLPVRARRRYGVLVRNRRPRSLQ